MRPVSRCARLALVVAVAALAAVVCARAASADTTINVELVGDIDYTDPALAYYGPSWQIEYAMCAMLMNYPDDPGTAGATVQPELADGMPTVTPDGLTYTFTIRSGFVFSNGHTLTSRDVADTFERTLSPVMQSPAIAFMSDIVGVDAYEAGTASHISGISTSVDSISFTLTAPAPDFLTRVAMPFFCVVPQGTAREPNGLDAIPMAGPYSVALRAPGSELVLVKNPYYGGSRTAVADSIHYTISGSAADSEARVESGASDYLAGVPADDVGALDAQYGTHSDAATAGHQQLFHADTAGVWYIAMNTSRTLFSDVRLRRAVAFALDRKTLATIENPANTPTDQFLPRDVPGNVDGDFYNLDGNDLAQARAYAAAAGVSPETPVSADLYTATGVLTDVAEEVQRELAQIGIDVVIHSFSRAEQLIREGTRGEPFDLAIDGWLADYFDPSDFLDVLFDGSTIQATNNTDISYFDDPTYNDRIHEAAALTGDARADAYASLDADISTEAAPAAAFANSSEASFFSSRIGCQLNQTVYGIDLARLCIRGVSAPVPTISDVDVSSGVPGTQLTLSGTGFSGVSSVTLCDVAASYEVSSAFSIRATVPADACSGQWKVTTSSGTATSTDAFSYVDLTPTITSVTPTAPADGTTTLKGTNFLGIRSVTYCGEPSDSFMVVSSTELHVTPPTGSCTGPWRVTNSSGTGASATAPPAVLTAPSIAGTATVGKTLTADGGVWSGSPSGFYYQWRRCDGSVSSCTVIVGGADKTSYTPVEADVGKQLLVWVRATNSAGSAWARSGLTGIVMAAATSPPVSTTAPSIAGTAQAGQTLTADKGAWSESPAVFYYQWRRCDGNVSSCVVIAGGADKTSYTLVEADVGHQLLVWVQATNGAGSTWARSGLTATIAAAPTDPPTNTAAPSIDGTPQLGQTLTATTGSWSNSPTGFYYQWRRCDGSVSSCTVITGGTDKTSYTPVDADVGKQLLVWVMATNTAGSSWARSGLTATISETPPPSTPPSNTTPPSIDGTPQVGQTLTADPGDWTESPTGYYYQWRRCDGTVTSCTVIAGGPDKTSYTPAEADLGKQILVWVQATNAAGNTWARSSLTATVLAGV